MKLTDDLIRASARTRLEIAISVSDRGPSREDIAGKYRGSASSLPLYAEIRGLRGVTTIT